MIVFDYVKWKNFLSYGQAWTEIDLSGSGKTLMVGDNGSGKSTFLDALSYALYGKAARDIKLAQLVNTINGKASVCEVAFRKGGDSYVVVRGQSPRVFEIRKNGTALPTEAAAKHQQNHLEEILGMDFRAFKQICIIGSAHYVPFMRLKTPERRELVEDLLDLQVFSSLNAVLKERVKKHQQQKDMVERTIGAEKIRIGELEKSIASLTGMKEQTAGLVEEHRRRVETKREEIGRLEASIAGMPDLSGDIGGRNGELGKLDSESRELETLRARIGDRRNRLTRKLRFLEGNDVCPECEQPIDAAFKKGKTDHLSSEVGKIDGGLVQLDERVAGIKTRMDGFRKEISELTMAQMKRQTEERMLSGMRSDLAGMERNVPQGVSDAAIGKSRDDLEQSRRKVDENRTTQKDLAGGQFILDIALDMLKDTGVKGDIVSTYTPIINHYVNSYLDDMNFFASVEFDQDFKETIKSRKADVFTYDSFSQGERMRIDLALLFTWRQISRLKNRAASNLLVLDEVMDSSLDADGMEEFLQIVDTLSESTATFIISHKPGLDDKFSKVLRFGKESGFSVMREAA